MDPLFVRQVGRYKFEVWDDSCRTTVHLKGRMFTLPAIPHYTKEYADTSDRLGYGRSNRSQYLCCIEHEAAHLYLTCLTNWRSPVMDSESGAIEWPRSDRLCEETVVVAFQKAINEVRTSPLAKTFRQWLWGDPYGPIKE